MTTTDPRIDTYIAKSADFAKPILLHLRKLIHAACPDVEETMKWSRPSFLHKGVLCGFAAFNQHCSFGFWKGDLIFGKGDGNAAGADAVMGQFGRLTTLVDLPTDKVLLGYIKEAVRLNDEGVKLPPRRKSKKKPIVIPNDLAAALKKNKKAQAAFANLSPSHRREYVEWIMEAKRDETRQKRLTTAVGWLAEGKSRNWKYEKC